jgi:hypothetical protein
MAGPFIVPQSGGAITISSTAAGFRQESANQYYMATGGTVQSDRFTFTFADGGSFYLTDFTDLNFSTDSIYVVGIPSAADIGYGSTVNVIGSSNLNATYDIHDATSNVKLVDNFQPQANSAPYYSQSIANFEYLSGLLTVRTPTQSSGSVAGGTSIGTTGTVTYLEPVNVNGYRGGAGSATPLSFALSGYTRRRLSALFMAH